MRPALQIAHAPLTSVKRLGPQASGFVQRNARVIAKRRTGAPFHPILPVAHDPFAGEVRRLRQHLLDAGACAGLQASFDRSSLLKRSREGRDSREHHE